MTSLSSPSPIGKRALALLAAVCVWSVAHSVHAAAPQVPRFKPTLSGEISPQTRAIIERSHNGLARSLQASVSVDTLAICPLILSASDGASPLCGSHLNTLLGEGVQQRMVKVSRLKASPLWTSLPPQTRNQLASFDYVLLVRSSR
jgi:hypothetical protein